MNPLLNITTQNPTLRTDKTNSNITAGDAQKKFAHALKDAIDNVNEMQIKSDKKTELLAAGKVDNLHDVMITAQKASITLETTVQVQKKAIDAYNEIMRMQV